MKNGLFLSYIIPAYNAELYLEKCIYSILKQTYTFSEIIIVNDGSTDNTQSVLDNISKENDCVRVIHKCNEGVSAARNEGLKQAVGDYVIFVDADDYLAEEYAEYMTKMIKSTGADFCISENCYTMMGESQVEQESIDILYPEQATALLLSPRIIVGCWNKIYRRRLLIDNNIFFSTDLFYGEGLRFITQVAQLSNYVGVGNRKVYYYRRNNYASACTKFNIENLFNGLKSINLIGDDLLFKGEHLMTMYYWHKCQFYMGAAVRLNSNKLTKKYCEFYKECASYVRENAVKLLFKAELPLYKRLLLLGCAISPFVMGKLDEIRRRQIATKSV